MTELSSMLSSLQAPIINSTDATTLDICSRADADANSGIYTFHLTGILFMATLSIFGNSMVIFIMTKECKMHSPMNRFIVSLACSDLFQGAIYAIYNIGHININSIRAVLGSWPVCCPVLMLVTMTLMSSAYNLVGITVIRFMSVCWPLQYHHMLTKGRTLCGILLCWLFPLILACTFYIRPKPDPWCGVCRSEMHWKLYQVAGLLVCSAVVPAFIMMLLYIAMNRIYAKHTITIFVQNLLKMKQMVLKDDARSKTLSRVSAFLVTYFLFSYLPFIVYTFIYNLCNCTISGYIRSAVRMVLFSNTVVNFFAYIVANQEFRRGLVKICCPKRYLEKRRTAAVVSISGTNNSDQLACRTCVVPASTTGTDDISTTYL